MNIGTIIKQKDKNWYILPLIAILYLIWVCMFVGLRQDHMFFIALCLGVYYLGPNARKLFFALATYIVYWMFYDSLRVYPNHMFNTVHIQQPYDIEMWLFGIPSANGLLIPCEYFAQRTNAFLDVLSGLFYLTWATVPVFFTAYLYLQKKEKRNALEVGYLFVLVNLIGFVIYYAYPAAPPWYVEHYGFELREVIDKGLNVAGLIGFDQALGVTLFQDMYKINPNPYAAIPSLHSAFPALLLFFALKKGMRKWSIVFLIQGLGMWFAAVYLRHHYFIDVLLGIACSGLAVWLFYTFLVKQSFFNTLLENHTAKL